MAFGMAGANVAWVGRDSPAEWTSTTPAPGVALTASVGWLLTGFPRTKPVGRGALIGVTIATVMAVAAALTRYAPPWTTEGWTGNGWTWKAIASAL
ncbi:hypothetical protein [Micromonospora sp. DT47]|uniref:hypothetical protein n=1 Tax=Micromonospora sp. DT47 TaxID=3393431 RepID=UPI003CE934DB